MVSRSAARAPAAPVETPMMRQYRTAKDANPGCLLFFRMGDFYELFFDDAVAAAAALDIALTRRGRHQGEDIPMCGVPVHAAESYLQRLIRKGFRVAVCEQIEEPVASRKRAGKTPVAREVVRVLTPGTLTEEALLDARHHNYLAALAEAGGAFGLAWLDMSTGEFHTQPVAAEALAAALARIDPGELLVADRLLARADLASVFEERAPTALPDARFDSVSARRRLCAQFAVAALDAFGGFDHAEIAAAGAALDYVALTQRGQMPRLAPPARLAAGAVMEIDAQTRRNLEIVEAISGGREGSLLGAIDMTLTGAGAREIAARLAAPLTAPAAIRARQDALAAFHDDADLREAVRAALRRCPDLARAVSRLTVGRGGPRDLAAVRDAIGCAGRLAPLLAADPPSPRAALSEAAAALDGHGALCQALTDALAPDLPLLARDGGFVAAGYDPALDELRVLRDDNRRLIAALQARYAEETGIASLKIRHNNVLGYFVEATVATAERLADNARFVHRQTIANARRFTTVELAGLERRLADAADRALARELEIFACLAAQVTAAAEPLAAAARRLAEIDVTAALAALAVERRHVRPVVDDGDGFEIVGGRHPVVELFLERDDGRPFIANDCDLGPDRRLWLVTGPNMAGKSTFLRQNALIAILAQIGAFVPAERAHIGVVDRLFSRVGAADDLARGRSTFMVEMVETAVILNQAGPRALVVLDEIGRGTATYDGLSIAWAALEHLHEVNRARALFATHFHELASLVGRLDALCCATMRVEEWGREIVFLHEVAPGAASQSYGIHVARLAGLPAAALARAEEVLETLETGGQSRALAALAEELPLFAAATPLPPPCGVCGLIEGVNPDELSPRAALDLLYRLSAASRGAGENG